MSTSTIDDFSLSDSMNEYFCFGCKAYFEHTTEFQAPTACPKCGHTHVAKVTLKTGPAWMEAMDQGTVYKALATLAGFVVGGAIGFLLRPSLNGEKLPFISVITRGAVVVTNTVAQATATNTVAQASATNLVAQLAAPLAQAPQISIPLAHTSFNYMLIGAIAGAVMGFIISFLLLQTVFKPDEARRTP